MAHFLDDLRMRFPRLAAVSLTENDKDEYTVEMTPAGPVETVYFFDRADFENAVIALAYQLQPKQIPPSMGAIFLNGLVDHVKMEKIAIVILSRGGYSAITAGMLKKTCAGLENGPIFARNCGCGMQDITEEMWESYSLTIRKNHELAHFVQRKLFPENKNALKDEIKADMVGIIEAFGVYDGFLARVFLGIEDETYRSGGRLENYISPTEDLPSLCDDARAYISYIEDQFTEKNGSGYQKGQGFDILIAIEEKEKSKKIENLI